MLLFKNKITGADKSAIVWRNNKNRFCNFVLVNRLGPFFKRAGSHINSIVAVFFMAALGTNSAWAIPVLSFDLDTTAPGIQGSRSVLLGDNFNVAVMLSNYDASTRIDTVSFDVNYNDSGMVLASTGDPLAGALVDMSPTETWDAFALAFTDINQGDTLTTLDLGVMPGYQSNIGYFLYSSLTDPFNLIGSEPIAVAMFSFSAHSLGSSLLTMAINPAALSVEGNPVSILMENGRINVINTVPEPATLLLFSMGLIGLLFSRSQRRH